MSGTITVGSLTSLSGASLNIVGQTGLNASAATGSVLISANAGGAAAAMYGCGSLLLGSHDGFILATATTTIVANGNSGVTLNSSAGPITVNGSGVVTIESNANNVLIAANSTGKNTSIYGRDQILVCSQSGSIDLYSDTNTNITSGATFNVLASGVTINSGSGTNTLNSNLDVIINALRTTYVTGTEHVSIYSSGTGGVEINADGGLMHVTGSQAVTIEASGTGTGGDVRILANHQLNLTSNGTATLSLYDSGGSSRSLTFNNHGTAYGVGITISGVAAPASNDDVANKQYVDSLVVGLNFKQSCRLRALVGGSPFDDHPTVTYSSGIITPSVGGIYHIDGQTLVNGDRILVAQDAISSLGSYAAGIYTYIIDTGTSTLTRAGDADIGAELSSAYTYIEAGTSANNAYVQTYAITSPHTDAENWILFSAVGSAADRTSHIGPTTLGANGYSENTGIPTMASVREITSGVSYIQNFTAGGLILESNVISQDTPATRYGPALYLTSPNCAGFGQKGVIRMVTQATSDGSDIYAAPESKLSVQRFGYIGTGLYPSPVITSISTGGAISNGTITMSADLTGSLTASAMCDGVEVMFSAPNADNLIGGVLVPTKTYYVKNYAINGATGVATFQVSETIGGAVVGFITSSLTGADKHIHLWREIGCFGS